MKLILINFLLDKCYLNIFELVLCDNDRFCFYWEWVLYVLLVNWFLNIFYNFYFGIIIRRIINIGKYNIVFDGFVFN